MWNNLNIWYLNWIINWKKIPHLFYSIITWNAFSDIIDEKITVPLKIAILKGNNQNVFLNLINIFGNSLLEIHELF